jgi:hypothetical protein
MQVSPTSKSPYIKLRNQVPTWVEADILGGLSEKFTSNDINLVPEPVFSQDVHVHLPSLDIKRSVPVTSW